MQPFNAEESWYCIVLPDVAVSTATVFADPELKRNFAPLEPADYSYKSTTNALQTVTVKHYPPVARAVAELEKFGIPRMNGSGSSVYLKCASRDQAETVQSNLPTDLNSIIARSFNALDILPNVHRSHHSTR